MNTNISNDNSLKRGMTYLKNTARNALNNEIKEIKDEGFNEGIDIGISNTINALFYANVNDESEIIDIVRKVWKLDEYDIENRIIEEKRIFLIKKIRKHLRLKGFEEINIKEFIQKNNILEKINRNNELWKLKNNPEKLIKTVEEE